MLNKFSLIIGIFLLLIPSVSAVNFPNYIIVNVSENAWGSAWYTPCCQVYYKNGCDGTIGDYLTIRARYGSYGGPCGGGGTDAIKLIFSFDLPDSLPSIKNAIMRLYAVDRWKGHEGHNIYAYGIRYWVDGENMYDFMDDWSISKTNYYDDSFEFGWSHNSSWYSSSIPYACHMAYNPSGNCEDGWEANTSTTWNITSWVKEVTEQGKDVVVELEPTYYDWQTRFYSKEHFSSHPPYLYLEFNVECGDGYCIEPNETVENCPQDCPGECGDDICNPYYYETKQDCCRDCGALAYNVCIDNENRLAITHAILPLLVGVGIILWSIKTVLTSPNSAEKWIAVIISLAVAITLLGILVGVV